jgi:hypothetical protein
VIYHLIVLLYHLNYHLNKIIVHLIHLI